MKIRPAVVQDVLHLAEIGRVLHEQSSFAGMAYDPDASASYLLSLIVNTNPAIDYFVYVAENDAGEVVGGMAGYCAKSWFGPDRTASDISLFIIPEARGGMTAVRLVKAYIEWAKAHGARQIRPGVSTGAIGSAAEGLYSRLGLSRVGSLFCLEV